MSTLADIFLDRLSWLGILETSARSDWEKKRIGPRIRLRRRIPATCHPDGTILILSYGQVERLLQHSDAWLEDYLSRLKTTDTALLIFARRVVYPDRFKKLLRAYQIPAATSSFSEPFLESRLKAVIAEKLKKRITVHGVAVELERCGILITGASGTGKTTAALQAAFAGASWIADDVVVVSKKKDGNLYLSGHRKIRKYVHRRTSGITAIAEVLDKERIKNKVRLTAMIEVIRSDNHQRAVHFGMAKMMDAEIILITLKIPRTGYLSKNLLINTTRKLTESRH